MPLNPLRPNYRQDSEFVPSQIVSANGLLSPKQSNAIMERLKRSVGPTDILERCTVVVESVVESPLTKGNKVNRITFIVYVAAITFAEHSIHL
jgi:3-hydroxyacyl-CoA dehydrogenase